LEVDNRWEYSAHSAYLLMHQGITAFPGVTQLWKPQAPLWVKLFLWLACRRRVWTADRRRHRGLDSHINCVLCDQEEETIDHLLVQCPMAKEVWWMCCSWVKCVCNFGQHASVQEWWEHLLLAQPPSRREGMSTMFMLICWHLWKEHNARVFDRKAATVPVLVRRIVEEAGLWVSAGARKLGRLCCE
jgi:hypothetical protein